MFQHLKINNNERTSTDFWNVTSFSLVGFSDVSYESNTSIYTILVYLR
jgi:hypothetical protein